MVNPNIAIRQLTQKRDVFTMGPGNMKTWDAKRMRTTAAERRVTYRFVAICVQRI